MALKTVDLTKQPCRALFTGCSQEEVSYAKTFWQSIQLLPPMESRLVSSDIKQRLRKAPPSRSLSECMDSLKSEAGSEPQSCNFTLSNSSCNLQDSISKGYRLFSQPQNLTSSRHESGSTVTDSLYTQTSRAPMFSSISTNGTSFGTTPDSKEVSGRGDDTKQHHRKISFSSSRKTSDGSNTLGAGGREFWSMGALEKNAGTEIQMDAVNNVIPFSGEDLCNRKPFVNRGQPIDRMKNIIPYSGEDLQHRKGFMNWGHQKVVSSELDRNTGNPTKSKLKNTLRLLETEKPCGKTKFTPPHRNRKLQTVVGTRKLPGQEDTGVSSLFKTTIISPNDTDYQSPGMENQFPSTKEKPMGTPLSAEKPTKTTLRAEKPTKNTLRTEKSPRNPLVAGKPPRNPLMAEKATKVGVTSKKMHSPKQNEEKDKSKLIGEKRYCQSLTGDQQASEGKTATPIIQCISDAEAIGFPKVADEPLVLTLPGNYTNRRTHSGESHLHQFFVRAKTMENIEEYRRLRMLASAREEDRELLHKHRAQRQKKEEISHRVDESSGSSTSQFLPPMSSLSAYTKEVSEEEQMLDEMWPIDVREEISKFEKMKKLEEPDSEDEQ